MNCDDRANEEVIDYNELDEEDRLWIFGDDVSVFDAEYDVVFHNTNY